MKCRLVHAALAAWTLSGMASVQAQAQQPEVFQPADVFELEYASDPQISPDGGHVVFVRNSMDIMTDRRRSSLWITSFQGTDQRSVAAGEGNFSSPRYSPDGSKLIYVASDGKSAQIYLRWMDTGEVTKLTHVERPPTGITWSPDGKWIAFSMLVPEPALKLARMPAKPKGAKWAPPVKVIDQLRYRADGIGYLEPGHRHIFVLPVEGGTPRQITAGNFDHGGRITWTPDSRYLIFSANRHEDWEHDPLNSEIYKVSVEDGGIAALTDRRGPDQSPAVSPDGSMIAYTGFDDRLQGYQLSHLYLMSQDGRNSRLLIKGLDRSVRNPVWSRDGKGIYFQYDDKGQTHLAYVTLDGKLRDLTADVGGLSIGRPYSSGGFSIGGRDRFAFTLAGPDHPADVGVGSRSAGRTTRITALNDDLLGHRKLGRLEEIWFESSFDGRRIQGWIVKPPDFDPGRKYPLLLEIHGGPFANYGPHFAAEIQLYAAAGYVVLYTNPRGSTSYGEEFGNLIHHNYPGQDYDDLMSGVDAVISKGYIDDDNLFVTGGSGGGVLTAWIVGKTNRFRAAVVAKPVINWYSFVLTADSYNFFYKYWFPGFPWEHQDHYMKRSPISFVGNVETPTMLMTGESDHRTPSSEAEQFYQALKLRNVPSVMVRVPGASHGIARRPSNLIAKVANILAWFERYRGKSTS